MEPRAIQVAIVRNSAGARFTAVNRLLVVVGSIVGGLALFSTGMSPGWAAGANSSGASSVVQGYTSLIDGGGYAPTGPEQSAAWTPSQAQTYANKLAALFAS